MRSLSEHERDFIRKLIDAGSQKSATIQQLLQSFYFLEAQGRGLIVHNQGNYAVLFLEKELHEDEANREKEVRSFLELASLLNYLNSNGYISVYKYKVDDFYFIQDGFDSHKRVGNEIVLNSKGYSSPNIETIIDGNKNVIYKGTVFKGENYSLISGVMTGNLYVSNRLPELIYGSESDTAVAMTQILTTPSSDLSSHSTPEQAGAVSGTKKVNISGKGNMKGGANKARFVATYLVAVLSIAAACYLIGESRDRIRSLEDKVDLLESSDRTLRARLDSRPLAPPQASPVAVTKLYGIDVSKWNGYIKNDLQRASNLSFAIVRATVGEKGVDSKFLENWNAAINKGLVVGAYHVLRADEDPFSQADHFINTLHAVGKMDMVPIVDVEKGSIPTNSTLATYQVQSALLSFLAHLEKKTNKKPMIYTDLAFANQYLANKTFAEYPLWLAEYSGAESPKLPVTWKDAGFKIWQKKDSYSVNSQDVDLDVFYGSSQDLTRSE